MSKSVGDRLPPNGGLACNETPALAGSISSSPPVELLAFAFNQRFQGTLVLERPRGAPLGIGFRAGQVICADAAEHNASCERQALEAHLPPDILRFAEQHGETQHVDVFRAIESLRLLPKDGLELTRAEYVTSQVLCCCAIEPDSRYGFLEREPAFAHPVLLATPLEPISLIEACIMKEPALERARQSVQAFQHEPLALASPEAIRQDALSGLGRQCIKRLSRAPASFVELGRQHANAPDQLVAFVYALFITGQVTLRTGPSQRPRPLHQSRVPRKISGQAYRVPVPDNPRPGRGVSPLPAGLRRSSPPGTRRSSSPSRSAAVSPQLGAEQEAAAESKVMKALALGQADQSMLEKARSFTGKVVQLFPDNARIRYCYACLQKRAQQFESAAHEFARVLELDPSHNEARRELDELLQRLQARWHR